jgi:hypothetical protein
MASAALITVSCSNNETVEIPSSAAIGFSNVFVDGNTKADPTITKDNLADYNFRVNGYVSNGKESSQIFKDEKLTKEEGKDWEYSSALRYWIDGGNYVFGAYAPAEIKGKVTTTAEKDASNIVTTITGFVSDGITDLLYDSPAPIVNVESTRTDRVPLNFNHMLSKVIFSFQNAFEADSKVQLTVKNVEISDAYSTADVKMIGTSPAKNNTDIVWSNWSDNTLNLDFGDVKSVTTVTNEDNTTKEVTTTLIASNKQLSTENALLLIPTGTDKTYSVTFDIEVYAGDNPILITTYEGVSANVTGVDFVPGYSYNFIAKLKETNINPDNELQPILFTVESVTDWVPNTADGYDKGFNVPAVTTTTTEGE